MDSVFILEYGWRDMQNKPLRETHPSIESATKSGDAFLAREQRFRELGSGAPAYYRIDRFDYSKLIIMKGMMK